MSRLSEDRIKQGILHDDIDVRFAALRYFSDSFSPDQTVMPVVIEALERFGRTKTFRYCHPIEHLAQTEKTIGWVLGELKNQPRRTDDERYYLSTLTGLLCHADARLLVPHEKEILTAPGFDEDGRQQFSRRLKLLSWDAAALWNELEAICEEGKDKEYAGDMRWSEGKDIVEALGRFGDADQMMTVLNHKIEDYENNPLTWMEPLMVRLAGEMRHAPAIPLIVAKLHEDAEVVSEKCVTALVKIGGDEVVQAIRQHYPTAAWHFRLYASGVLGRVHTDLAVQVGIEFLEKEEDLDLENWLAQSVVEHFSNEGNEAARKVLLHDPDLFDLQRALVPVCTLMEHNFPELAEWKKEIEEKMRARSVVSPSPGKATSSPGKVRTAPTLAPIVKTEKKVGRNDSCPCGSGKKYKKCCMNKRSPI